MQTNLVSCYLSMSSQGFNPAPRLSSTCLCQYAFNLVSLLYHTDINHCRALRCTSLPNWHLRPLSLEQPAQQHFSFGHRVSKALNFKLPWKRLSTSNYLRKLARRRRTQRTHYALLVYVGPGARVPYENDAV